jgi:hypothetical protein
MQRAVSFVAKVRGEVFTHFHAVNIKHHSSTRNWQKEFFVNSPLDVKEKYGRVLDLALHQSRLFFISLDEFGLPMSGSRIVPRTLVLLLAGSPSKFSEIYTKLDGVSLLDPWLNRHQSRYTSTNGRTYKINTSTQLREMFLHSVPSYTSTIIYRCIALQLLYNESPKLWITPGTPTNV